MNRHMLAAGALAVALMGLIGAPLDAQLPPGLRDYPLAQRQKSGDLVAPFFDGWIANRDGSVTMVFGFMNRNTEEIIDIPLGEDNYIFPPQFDGMQPTHFPVYDRRGFHGIRERGAFAVTVPASRAGTEVVWTLSHAGHTYSVPGRATSTAYEMSRMRRARGSLSPAIQFIRGGAESTDREGIVAEPVMATVGTPVTLSALVQDRGERRGYDVDSLNLPGRHDLDPASGAGSDPVRARERVGPREARRRRGRPKQQRRLERGDDAGHVLGAGRLHRATAGRQFHGSR